MSKGPKMVTTDYGILGDARNNCDRNGKDEVIHPKGICLLQYYLKCQKRTLKMSPGYTVYFCHCG